MLVTVASLAVGCTKPNPAFDEDGTATDDFGDGDLGDGDPDGDPGDSGDGDGECMLPLSECSGDCVDPNSDPNNCGDCGVECPGSCMQGSCTMGDERIVFVSSGVLTGMMGGFEGADALCMELAAAAGLAGEFEAWLSNQMVGPNTSMTHYQMPYRLVTGQLIANDWTDLTDGTISHTIDRTEEGATISNIGVCEGREVWTNTKPDGSPASSMDCGDWNSEGGTSIVGRFLATDGSWTEYTGCPSVTCMTPLPIYCVQQ